MTDDIVVRLQEAVDALAAYQQADMDGCMVLVSRRAIEECLPHLRAMIAHAALGEKVSDAAAQAVRETIILIEEEKLSPKEIVR